MRESGTNEETSFRWMRSSVASDRFHAPVRIRVRAAASNPSVPEIDLSSASGERDAKSTGNRRPGALSTTFVCPGMRRGICSPIKH